MKLKMKLALVPCQKVAAGYSGREREREQDISQSKRWQGILGLTCCWLDMRVRTKEREGESLQLAANNQNLLPISLCLDWTKYISVYEWVVKTLSCIMKDRKSFTIRGSGSGCCCGWFKLAFIAFIPSALIQDFALALCVLRFTLCIPKICKFLSLPWRFKKDVAGNGNVLGRRNYHGSQRKGAQRGARRTHREGCCCCCWAEDVIRVKAKWEDGKIINTWA